MKAVKVAMIGHLIFQGLLDCSDMSKLSVVVSPLGASLWSRHAGFPAAFSAHSAPIQSVGMSTHSTPSPLFRPCFPLTHSLLSPHRHERLHS